MLGRILIYRNWSIMERLLRIEKARYGLPKLNIHYSRSSSGVCFRSVVVITSASHAEGRRFEPGRKQFLVVAPIKPYYFEPKLLQIPK